MSESGLTPPPGLFDVGPMAKRKKRAGGGAFGGGRTNPPAGPVPMAGPAGGSRDIERMMKAVRKIAASQEFESPEDFQNFLNAHVVGRPPEELAAMLEDGGPRTPLEQADRLMDEIPEDALPEEYVRTAKQALTLSEDCIAAWLELGIQEEDAAKAMERFEQGIARGRVRFKEQIEAATAERGLWGWIEARDFMRLLHEVARLQEVFGAAEAAIAIYQEMLALNPNDNQGIRGDLLRLLLVFRRLEDGRKLLDAFPNDAMTDMAHGRAFVSIVEAMDRSGFDLPDTPGSSSELLKRLGPEFDQARMELKRAVKLNPFVALFIVHPGLMEVEIDEMAVFGGPYEAAEHARKWCALWYVSGLPFLLLNSLAPNNPKKLLKSPVIAEELADVIEQLESFQGAPWWDRLDDSEF